MITSISQACMGPLLLLLLAFFPHAKASDDGVFDVSNYGATPGRKNSRDAFLVAWKEACKYKGSSSFLIPHGTFMLGPVAFKGPCHNGLSPRVRIDGFVKAIPDLADYHSSSWIEFANLSGLHISGNGTLDGQGGYSWPRNDCHRHKFCKIFPTTLNINEVRNSTIARISLINSKAFHTKLRRCSFIDVHDLKITAPEHSPNTDGIHIGRSDHIKISNMTIGTGDDCISIGPGSIDVSISNVTCGPGHGISIGSLGKYAKEMDVVGIHVKNCTIKNTTNGVRVKTWPGSGRSRASNLTFEDIIMENVTNPIIVDQRYCPVGHCTDEPSHVKINNLVYRRINGTSRTKIAVNIFCSKVMPCNNVQLSDINLECVGGDCDTTTSSCDNVEGSFSGMQNPISCFHGSIGASPMMAPMAQRPIAAPEGATVATTALAPERATMGAPTLPPVASPFCSNMGWV